MECSEALFDTIDTLLLRVNPDGTIKYFNRVCREATGYSLEETEGRMFWEVFSLWKKANSSRTFLRKPWNLPTVLLMNTSGAVMMGAPG